MKQIEELLGENLADPTTASASQLAMRLGTAAFLGLLVAGIYTYSRAPKRRMAGLPQTLLLLCPLITMVTMAVGQNIAAAFTLVGTLAIVRFRTAVRDTRDTVFVIFAVAAGLAIGAFNIRIALVGVAVIGSVALLSRMFDRGDFGFPSDESEEKESKPKATKFRLTLSPPDADLASSEELLRRHADEVSLVRSEVDRKNQRLVVTYRMLNCNLEGLPELLNSLLENPEVLAATAE